MRLTDLVRSNTQKERSKRSAGKSEKAAAPEEKQEKRGVVKRHATFLQSDDIRKMLNTEDSSGKPGSGQRGTVREDVLPAGETAGPESEQPPGNRGRTGSFGLSLTDTFDGVGRDGVEKTVGAGNERARTQPQTPRKTGTKRMAAHRPDAPVNNIDEEDMTADRIHIEVLDILDEVYDQAKRETRPGVEKLVDPIHFLIEHGKKSNALLRKSVRLKKGRGSQTAHALNASILAIKMGINRGYSDERLFSLAMCSLLGDVGMTRVDPSILDKSGKLTSEEFEEIKKHAFFSVEILSQVADVFPFLPPIVAQIHERENGSGYPKGLRGENIHEFAKIIGLCDVYVALTEKKANRENYSGYVALQQIIARRNVDFSPRIIKSLIDVISVFPLESLVRLNNGNIGRVVEISSMHPTRPKLKILVNNEGEKLLRPTYLDLEKEPLLYVEDPDIEEGMVL